MQLRAARRRLAFEHLLDKVDATPWTIELIAQQLIGRAGRVTEAAVHALAQNGFGFQSVRGVKKFGGEFSLHVGCWLAAMAGLNN